MCSKNLNLLWLFSTERIYVYSHNLWSRETYTYTTKKPYQFTLLKERERERAINRKILIDSKKRRGGRLNRGMRKFICIAVLLEWRDTIHIIPSFCELTLPAKLFNFPQTFFVVENRIDPQCIEAYSLINSSGMIVNGFNKLITFQKIYLINNIIWY